MTELIFLGFDVSSTGVGAALIREDGSVAETWVWQSDNRSESFRLRSLAEWAADVELYWIDNVMDEDDVILTISMEGPFLRGKGSLPLIRAQGAVMVQFVGDWEFYQPQAVKAVARRSAGLTDTPDKDQMIAAAAKRWPEWKTAPFLGSDSKKAEGDIADALWVAETDRLQVLKNRRGEE